MNILKPFFMLCWFVGAMIRPDVSVRFQDDGSEAKIGAYQPMMTMDQHGDWSFSEKFLSDLNKAVRQRNEAGTVWVGAMPALVFPYPKDRQPKSGAEYCFWAAWSNDKEIGIRPDGVVVWRKKK